MSRPESTIPADQTELALEPPTGAPTRVVGPRHYLRFNLAAATWFGAWGMQMLLITWLLVGELAVAPELVGFAQMALMLPAPIFLLVGGVTADRYDRRNLLIGLHALAGSAAIALAGVVWTDRLSYPAVVAYALALGTIQAFVFPTRDALLSQVAGSNMLRAVAGVTIVQFSLQALGSLSGGLVQNVGSGAALALQGAILLAGIVPLRSLPAAPPARPKQPLQAGDLLAGVREVFHSPEMRPPMFLTAGIGLFFMGPYFVAFPVMLRDYWHGTSTQLGLLQGMFPFAAMLGTCVVMWLGAISHKGRAMALAQTGGALCLLWVSTGVSFAMALGIALIWGLCGSVFLNASRTLFQESAPETHRARVLSVYNLGFMGAGAIGLPLAGFFTDWLGPHGAFRVAGVAMLLFLFTIAVFADLRRVR